MPVLILMKTRKKSCGLGYVGKQRGSERSWGRQNRNQNIMYVKKDDNGGVGKKRPSSYLLTKLSIKIISRGRQDGSESTVIRYHKTDSLNLIPRTHMVESNNWLPQVVFWPTFLLCVADTHTYKIKIFLSISNEIIERIFPIVANL